MRMKPVIVLPTYNEKENLEPFVRELRKQFDGHLLIVDDNSPDGTGEIAEALAKRDARVAVLHRAGKLGLGSAYVKGFQWALERDFDAVLEMDSDFSHDPADVPRLLEALQDCELALGSRYVAGGAIQNWPWHRLAISGLGNWYARAILWAGVKDLTGGFKAYRREALQAIDLPKIWSDGYAFQIETTFRVRQKGFRIREVPIRFKDRTRGVSKISRRVLWEALWLVWKLRLGL